MLKLDNPIQKAGGIVEFIRNVSKRILFHFASLLAGMGISRLSVPEFFYSYIGLICLFPYKFAPNKNKYLFPLVVSSAMFLFLWLWRGIPPAVALLWAGALSWLLHALILRFKMGWKWLVMPFLVLCISGSARSHSFPVILFAAGAVCGYAAYFYATLREHQRLMDKSLRKTMDVLSPVLKSRTFPGAFDAQMRQLNEHSADFLRADAFRKSRLCEALFPRLQALVQLLTDAVNWPEERFQDREANLLLASLADMNNLLDDALRDDKGQKVYLGQGGAAKGQAPDEFAEFSLLAQKLLDKKDKLPPELQKHVNSLFLSTESIIGCMREDPADRPSGARFLNRFLPAAQNVVDEYIRLGGGSGHENTREVLSRSENLLERMAVAFHEEHGNLLRNDAMRFSADLNVLDKLLKMEKR